MRGPYRAADELSHQMGHFADIDPTLSMSASLLSADVLSVVINVC